MIIVHFWWLITSATNAFYGIVSGWLGDVGLFAGIIIYLRHKNCHVKGCYRLGKHQVANGKYTVCAVHHPEVSDKITAKHIAQVHQNDILNRKEKP